MQGVKPRGLKAWWSIPDHRPEGDTAQLKHLSDVVTQVLHNRGIIPEEIEGFLYPKVAAMHAPLLMRGMAEAVQRLQTASVAGEEIAVYGDYDVDGMTATVLLYQILRVLGARCRYYVPHRSKGYGLKTEALDVLHAQGVTVVVTVDCGIRSAAEVAYARGLGMDVIITDHHTPPAHLPAALAILNPRQPLCGYPFKSLAGVGIAFKLASALVEGRPDAQRLRQSVLDLVAIGTVSDMVPLRGENRVLVQHGLHFLTRPSRAGLRALLDSAGLEHATISAADIGYMVGPRLNAAGRMDDPNVGCRLLLTTDADEARELAGILELKNRERKRRTAEVLEEARERIAREGQLAGRVLVVDDSAWQSGVIGLVAGRLADEFCRPAFVIERGDVESRGSARSIPLSDRHESGADARFDLNEVLGQCRDLLIDFGGHEQAAGFSLLTENIPRLRDRLGALAAARLRDDDLDRCIEIDAEIDGRQIGAAHLGQLYDQLAELEPFGMENQAPVLLWRNLRVAESRAVGHDGKHLRLTLATPFGTVGAIAFDFAGEVRALQRGGGGDVLPRGTPIDVVCSLQYNEWNGNSTVELRVKDVAIKGGAGRDSDHAPQASLASP